MAFNYFTYGYHWCETCLFTMDIDTGLPLALGISYSRLLIYCYYFRKDETSGGFILLYYAFPVACFPWNWHVFWMSALSRINVKKNNEKKKFKGKSIESCIHSTQEISI